MIQKIWENFANTCSKGICPSAYVIHVAVCSLMWVSWFWSFWMFNPSCNFTLRTGECFFTDWWFRLWSIVFNSDRTSISSFPRWMRSSIWFLGLRIWWISFYTLTLRTGECFFTDWWFRLWSIVLNSDRTSISSFPRWMRFSIRLFGLRIWWISCYTLTLRTGECFFTDWWFRLWSIVFNSDRTSISSFPRWMRSSIWFLGLRIWWISFYTHT